MAFTAKILSWRFRHLNIVGCLLKRRPTKGGHGHPRTPLATPLPSWWPTTVTAKPKTSRQNQMLHSKNKIALVLPWVFAFAVRYLAFAVKYLVSPWGLWFCREGFGFVVRYFVFTVRFLVLPWVFVFAVRFLVLPWQLWATVNTWYVCRWYIHNYSSWLYIHNWMFLK